MKEDRTTDRHPSYGLLQISRTTGGDNNLFGSNIRHRHSVRLRISRASRDWHLHEFWYHDEDQLIEVELSPVQWAEAIINMNTSPGSPCTIRHIKGEGNIPNPPDNQSVTEQYRNEFAASCKRVVKELSEHMKAVEAILAKPTINKGDRATILNALGNLRQELVSNLPFVHEQFDEAVEKTVTQAKGEVEAFFTHAVIAAGMEAIAHKMAQPEVAALEYKPPFTLENKEVQPNDDL